MVILFHANMTQNHLTSKNDALKSLYDIEDIDPSKKERKKRDDFKNTEANKLIKEATNALKSLTN